MLKNGFIVNNKKNSKIMYLIHNSKLKYPIAIIYRFIKFPLIIIKRVLKYLDRWIMKKIKRITYIPWLGTPKNDYVFSLNKKGWEYEFKKILNKEKLKYILMMY